MSNFWENILQESDIQSTETSVETSYVVACDVLNIMNKTNENSKERLLTELDRLTTAMKMIEVPNVENAAACLMVALSSLESSITTDMMEIFRSIALTAAEAFSVALTFSGKLLASQIEIICAFYLCEYFSSHCNIAKLAAACTVIFEKLLAVPEVSAELAAEFERRKLSTRLWLFVSGGADAPGGDVVTGRSLVDAMGALVNTLEQYTTQRYPIRDKNGELVYLNVAYLRGHTGAVLCLEVSSGLGMLLSGSADRSIKVTHHTPHTHTLAYHVVHSALTMPLIVSASLHMSLSVVQVWDVHSLVELATLGTHQSAVTALHMSNSGDRLVSGSEEGALKLWDLDILTEVACSATGPAGVSSLTVHGETE